MGRINRIQQRGSLAEDRIRILNGVLNLVRVLGLLVILILATSHESANPKLGNTSIDFYFIGTQEHIKTQLGELSATLKTVSSSDSFLISLTQSFYASRAYQPAWTINFATNPSFHRVDTLFNRAKEYGLLPEYYWGHNLEQLVQQMQIAGSEKEKIAARANFEIRYTQSVLSFALHLSKGLCVSSEDVSVDFSTSMIALLNYALNDDVIDQVLINFQPQSIQYKLLQQGLAHFVKTHSLTELDEKLPIDADSAMLFQRLRVLGFACDNLPYSAALLDSSLKGFQYHHGLKPTGVVNSYTLKHLNTSNKYRFYQAALNLDRLRKVNITDTAYLFVNIPEYKLRFIDQNSVVREHIVVVGKPSSPTPELRSEIVKIVANPYWTVPRSISYTEILPHVRKDSNYLKRNGYEVIDNFLNSIDHSSINWQEVTYNELKGFWIRQKHGKGNALGSVKFHFPNEYSVFLHDTPSQSKFSKDIRAYSHGCVRVDNPEELAEFVLQHFAQSEKNNFKELIKKREHKEIALEKQLPVYLKYVTAGGDSEGNIFFYTDIYSKDDEAINALFPGWAS